MDLEELTRGTSFGALLFRFNPAVSAVYREVPGGELEVLAVNEEPLKVAGWAPEDVIGLRLEDLLHPTVVAAVMDAYRALAHVGDVRRFEVAAEVPAGRRVYDVTMLRLEDVDGVPHALTVSLDITEHREVEEALSETQEIAGIGHWSWDLETDELRSTYEVRRLYGIELDERVLDVSLFWEKVHEDDVDRLRRELAVAIEDGVPWVSQYRVRRPSDIRFVYGRGVTVRDEHGKALRLAGTVQDITEQRAAEEAARRAAEAEQQQRQALELNDDIVQGLATVRLALMGGDEDLALETLDRTMASARSIISQLLAAKVEGGIGPGDMVRDRSAADVEQPTSGGRG